jgi:hypothetical protein
VGGGRCGARRRRSIQSPACRRRCWRAERRGEQPLDWWRRAFALTYSPNFEPSGKGGGSVVDCEPDRYERFTGRRWRPIRRAASADWAGGIEGKMLSVVRLAKASATFAGGADYIAWKINRHAGTNIV